MSSFFTLLIIGISLSMDAFSLALIYGIQGMNQKEKIFLSLIVGIYHFIMPIIGLSFGTILSNINIISIDLIATLILIYIGVDLIISNLKKEEDRLEINKTGFLIFGLSVSIDSLTLGIGLKAITNSYLMSSIIFSLTSLFFTYLGLTLGNIIGKKIGSYSKIIGGSVLIIISIILTILTIWLLIKYGLKIYKVGILNYSSKDLWKKMWKALKD